MAKSEIKSAFWLLPVCPEDFDFQRLKFYHYFHNISLHL